MKFVHKNNVPSFEKYKHKLFGMISKEAYHLMRMDNPNIIQFIDYFNEEEYFVIITEFHGTFWTLDNPKLTPDVHTGLLAKERQANECSPYASVFSQLDQKELALYNKLPPCDLFECLDLRMLLFLYLL
jgi:PAS domain-containing serine/threonine kinase